MVKISLGWVGLLIMIQPVSLAQSRIPVEVTAVRDGDTLEVKDALNQTAIVRLGCIDAPEFTQKPWGLESTRYLEQLVAPGDSVEVQVIEFDDYQRIIGEVFKGDRLINVAMLQAGQAVVYRHYINQCQKYQDQYLSAEYQARQQQLGFWQQSNPEMPWVYRQRHPRSQ